MIKVSDSAKERVEQLMKEGGYNIQHDFVRVGVKREDVRVFPMSFLLIKISKKTTKFLKIIR